MFLKQLDLTTALRPSLLPDETLLFVQDAVGLYDGKFKIPEYQNGHAYLTSHRACYVDNEEPRKYAVAIDLKDVDRSEFYAGFLKSSPKVTLYPKPLKRTSLSTRGPPWTPSPAPTGGTQSSPQRSLTASPAPLPASATWVCPICSFSNPIPSNFDPATANNRTPIPPCLACGIKPPLVHVVKAAINAMGKRQAVQQPITSQQATTPTIPSNDYGTFRCPRCTFENHPSLINCEMCGASLVSAPDRRLDLGPNPVERSESPAPMFTGLAIQDDAIESVKFSFRNGGDKIFHERLKGALVQRKWLLQSAPPVPQPMRTENGNNPIEPPSTIGGSILDRNKVVGIAGLERRGQEQRKNNELVLGNAFEDLEALMTSAKEVIALAEKFSSQANPNGTGSEADAVLSQSASALGLVTTKDMLSSGSDSLYISELSRNLAEFLTDDSKGVLKREGGIISLVDLWAVFNRSRGGVELISPNDFEKAAQLWDKLKLPVRLRRFKSGLLVVQGYDRTDEKTIAGLLSWLGTLHSLSPGEALTWDSQAYGRGVTAQEVAEHFGWSLGVATEELDMAEEQGALCREQGLDGIRFWENWLMKLPPVQMT
ncbi:EAP30/Vps36 family protein [Rhizodiscina lignyota]|uniref:Vacuolar protein-sorting-associated protein 36 n=1 Tax=Rhizodiscina lignyota TaxID=1504668 RepID=A0A9P4I6T7_9PEZI|nr:EAP30/Vps36 family protein [Rhizodiscina lignyota]